MKKLKIIFLFSLFIFPSTTFLLAQSFSRVDTVPVKINGKWLKFPWAGGHNYVQLSDIDMNFDGIKDLFVFDRTGHKITTYINKGTPNTVDYVDSTSTYASAFPHLEDWALIRDFNCDGKPDIFTYAITVGGIKVWKNTSSGGKLQFTLEATYIKSNYNPSVSNLYVSRVDLPTIDDIDGDGDLDVLTMDFSAIIVEYHINKSKELGYGCDSLIFQLDPNGCWGNFQEYQSSCGVSLNVSCRKMNYDSLMIRQKVENIIQERLEQHAGNCSLCLDMDGDGDKEILLGQVGCCNIFMLTNGGTPTNANIIAKDSTFPSGNIPVNMTAFPCGNYLDVNNDGKRDLIFCPNMPNIGVDIQGLWYYKNLGTDSIPIFSRVKRDFLQDEMIDVGSGSDPVFFDINSDGLTDLLVTNYTTIEDTCPSSYSYGTWAFKNIGNAVSPKFDLVNTDYANFSIQLPNMAGKHLTFGDIDNDGDEDMYVGDFNGFIHFFTNTAGPGNPATFVLTMQNDTDDTGIPIDVGNFSTPQLVDIDRDGDLDLIIGERAGNLNYFENIGTISKPSFTFITGSFGAVDVVSPCCTGYSVPFIYDSLGSYRMIVGSEASKNNPAMGQLWYYKNIDGNLTGNFTLVDSLYHNIWEGQRMTVFGKDINNDGGLDLIIGNYCGGLALYMSDSNNVSVQEQNSELLNFNIYPNPSSGEITIHIPHFSSNSKYELKIFNSIGQPVYCQQIKSSQLKIAADFSKGIYYCELRADQFTKTKKIVIIK